MNRQGSQQPAGRRLGRSTVGTNAAGEVGTDETERERKGDRERRKERVRRVGNEKLALIFGLLFFFTT